MLDEKFDILVNKISFDLFFGFKTKKISPGLSILDPGEKREKEYARSRFKLTLSSTPDRLAPIV